MRKKGQDNRRGWILGEDEHQRGVGVKTDNDYQPYDSADTSRELEDIENLAPELTLEEAAKATKRFINDLPNDIIDIDLGSGL